MRKLFKSKKAVSPVIAVLLMIVIAVASAILVYAFIISFTVSQSSRASTLISIETVRFIKPYGATADIYVRNVGAETAIIAAIYVDGENVTTTTPPLTQTIVSNQAVKITITKPTNTWVVGTTYIIKVVTSVGAYDQSTFRA